MYAIYELTNTTRVVAVTETLESYDSNVYGNILVPESIKMYSPYFSVIDDELVYDESKKNDMENVRAIRNNTLAITDWTQVSDVPLSPDEVHAWRTYRQELRDWPSTHIPGDKWWESIPLEPGVTRDEYISQEQFHV
jgi:hypothetical protein